MGDEITNSINVYPLNGTGNIAPIRSISGANTGIPSTEGVAVDGTWIYAADSGTGNVSVFPIGATGDIAPTHANRLAGRRSSFSLFTFSLSAS